MTSVIERKTRGPVRFLRLPEVLARTGLSRSTIYVRLDQGRFPPAGLAGRSRGWLDRGRGRRVDARAHRGEPKRRECGHLGPWRNLPTTLKHFTNQFSDPSFLAPSPSAGTSAPSTGLTARGRLIQTSAESSAARGGPATKRSGRAA